MKCENLRDVPIDPKPGKQRHGEVKSQEVTPCK